MKQKIIKQKLNLVDLIIYYQKKETESGMCYYNYFQLQNTFINFIKN